MNQKEQKKQLLYHDSEVVHDLPHFNPLQAILLALRIIPIAAITCAVILFQQYIRPHIMIPAIRRYISCIVNLFCLRVVLLLLGFFRFECENYRYFDKSYTNSITSRSRMLTFRSGWVGMASHKNIIDFIYYAYMFNPVFTRIIQYHCESGVKYLYTPLTFKQAFQAALFHRGFDPIILNGQFEFKRYKKRKMQLPVLVSECFEETNGPILIMLPGITPNEHMQINEQVGRDIFQNQRKFLRSGVLFISEIETDEMKRRNNDKKDIFHKIYTNQTHLVMEMCSRFNCNYLSTSAHELIKRKYDYTQETFARFADQYFINSGMKLVSLPFREYLTELDQLDQQIGMHEN